MIDKRIRALPKKELLAELDKQFAASGKPYEELGEAIRKSINSSLAKGNLHVSFDETFDRLGAYYSFNTKYTDDSEHREIPANSIVVLGYLLFFEWDLACMESETSGIKAWEKSTTTRIDPTGKKLPSSDDKQVNLVVFKLKTPLLGADHRAISAAFPALQAAYTKDAPKSLGGLGDSKLKWEGERHLLVNGEKLGNSEIQFDFEIDFTTATNTAIFNLNGAELDKISVKTKP